MAPTVDEALAAIPRADFLPESARGLADSDAPVSIGRGQTNSQPRTVAFMLELLEVRPGHRVLDVGSGSGWTTALLGYLVGPEGEVTGTELEPELATWGAANLRRCAMEWTWIRQASPEELGYPPGAPYDRILVSAAARRLPEELVDQLGEDGIMVIPVDGTMTRVRRTGPQARDRTVSGHGPFRFVPLR